MNKRIKDISNHKFGSLLALSYSHSHNRQAYWKYRCDCGIEVVMRANEVTYQHKKPNGNEFPSCGCKNREQKTKHGYRNATKSHPLYGVYRGMINRCYNNNMPNYPAYGGLGVTVYEGWLNNPKAFIEWALNNGWKEGLELDKDLLCIKHNIKPRIYSPSTCQFIPKKINSGIASKRINYGNHPNIKLSQQEVNEILNLYFSGVETNQSELARMYGLKSPSSIGRLIKKAKGLG